jgi:hypothetical protein
MFLAVDAQKSYAGAVSMALIVDAPMNSVGPDITALAVDAFITYGELLRWMWHWML